MFKNGYNGIDKQSPLILGHEISGIIEQVGKYVKEYKNGMRVVVAPNMGCGLCDKCISGNTQLCTGLPRLRHTLQWWLCRVC